MLNHMLAAVNAVLPTFLIIALGFFIRRRGMVDERSLTKFNSVAFRVFLACQIFLNVYNSQLGEAFDLKLVIFTAIGLPLAGLLSLLLSILVEPRRDRRGVMAQGMFRGNFVLLGMPLILSLFGPDAAGLTAVMIAINIPIYNVLSVIFLELFAGGEINTKKMLRDIATNPLIDATFLALLFKLLRIPLDRVPILMSTMGSVAAVATPLCLFILGASFTPSSIGSGGKSLWITVAMKLLILPGAAIAAAAAIGIRGLALGLVLLSFGAPTAVTSYNMARELGGDAELAASIVVVDTALSCLTLFAWIVLLKTLGLF